LHHAVDHSATLIRVVVWVLAWWSCAESSGSASDQPAQPGNATNGGGHNRTSEQQSDDRESVERQVRPGRGELRLVRPDEGERDRVQQEHAEREVPEPAAERHSRGRGASGRGG